MMEDKNSKLNQLNNNVQIVLKYLDKSSDSLKLAYCETYDIILHMEDDIKNRIPKDIMQFLYYEKDKNYKVNIDYTKDINSQELLRDTRVLLSIIYKKYILEQKSETNNSNENKKY